MPHIYIKEPEDYIKLTKIREEHMLFHKPLLHVARLKVVFHYSSHLHTIIARRNEHSEGHFRNHMRTNIACTEDNAIKTELYICVCACIRTNMGYQTDNN